MRDIDLSLLLLLLGRHFAMISTIILALHSPLINENAIDYYIITAFHALIFHSSHIREIVALEIYKCYNSIEWQYMHMIFRRTENDKNTKKLFYSNF